MSGSGDTFNVFGAWIHRGRKGSAPKLACKLYADPVTRWGKNRFPRRPSAWAEGRA